jgi:hypothetical protein
MNANHIRIKKCRDNLLYRLRKKGIKVDTKMRTIYCKSCDLYYVKKFKQVDRLPHEFGFGIQLKF